MSTSLAESSRAHLEELLVAVQRCVYFLEGARAKVAWPLSGKDLACRSKDLDFFTALSAVNERFAKLQDTLGSAMRHAAVLSGESADTFLRVLAYFEKVSVLSSLDDWQSMRALRNLAAHEYGTDYDMIADHFNSLNTLVPCLYTVSLNFVHYCRDALGSGPANRDFEPEFFEIMNRL